MNTFSSKTIKKLSYYVYVLTYQENNDEYIFYVGKGKDNRVFAHFYETQKLDSSQFKDKHNILKNKTCNAYIIESGMTEKNALKLESSLINIFLKFKITSIKNIISGQHKYDIYHVDEIEKRFGDKINLEAFAKQKQLKLLVIKLKSETYMSSINNDHRVNLEGMWKMSEDRLEDSNYILGVYEQNIFGIYQYVKKSCVTINDEVITNGWYDKWIKKHHIMGRNEQFERNIEIDFNRKTFELKPIIIENRQKNRQFNSSDPIKFLFKKTIADKKIKAQSPIMYFGY